MGNRSHAGKPVVHDRKAVNTRDLEMARERLCSEALTLSIVKDGEVVFETSLHGISGFLEAIEKCGNSLEGASVADKVVGKAISLLCVHAKVEAVYAMTLSKEARKMLAQHTIYHKWDCLVENILDSDGTRTCPFETLATEISDPQHAYTRLKALQNSLRKGR